MAFHLHLAAKALPNAHPFVKFVFDEMARQHKPKNVVAEKSGVGYATLTGWQRCKTGPTLFLLEAVLNVLGYKLIIVKTEKENGHPDLAA